MTDKITATYDVAIIGAGILGLSAAYHLSNRNLRCVVLEREQSFAVHASGRNAGMFRQLYRNEQLSSWASRSKDSWPEEVRKLAFKRTGSLILGRQAPEHHEHLFEELSLACRDIKGRQLDVPGVYTATDGLLDPHAYAQAIYQLCNRRFVDFRFSHSATSIAQHPDYWSVECSNGKRFAARWLVNAAGAWLNALLDAELGSLAVEAQAYARHLFRTGNWPLGYMPEPNCGYYWDEVNSWYMREWSASERLVSICDKVPADPDNFAPSQELMERVSQTLLYALPEVADQLTLIRSWHCFRTYTGDQLPVWGEDPRANRLFWLAAFGGFGMSTSFSAAQDAASYIAGEGVPVPEAFSPERVRTLQATCANSL